LVNLSGQDAGESKDVTAPSRFGPLHCGQSPAVAKGASTTRAAHATVRAIIIFLSSALWIFEAPTGTAFHLTAEQLYRLQQTPASETTGIFTDSYATGRRTGSSSIVESRDGRRPRRRIPEALDHPQRNPGAKVGPRGVSSRFAMPGAPEFYAPQDVPHGKVEINWHHSAILDQVRGLYVYTLPGYASGGDTRYPVLYLLHGSGDLENGWTDDGKTNFILDNLIAAGKAKPMIVVMPRGHVHTWHQIDRQKNNEQVGRVLVEELMPFVESQYRVLTDRDNRAIAGRPASSSVRRWGSTSRQASSSTTRGRPTSTTSPRGSSPTAATPSSSATDTTPRERARSSCTACVSTAPADTR
jgi:hypothetical protein